MQLEAHRAEPGHMAYDRVETQAKRRSQAREVTLAEEKALLRHPIFLPAQESESDRSGAMDCNLRLWYCRR